MLKSGSFMIKFFSERIRLTKWLVWFLAVIGFLLSFAGVCLCFYVLTLLEIGLLGISFLFIIFLALFLNLHLLGCFSLFVLREFIEFCKKRISIDSEVSNNE